MSEAKPIEEEDKEERRFSQEQYDMLKRCSEKGGKVRDIFSFEFWVLSVKLEKEIVGVKSSFEFWKGKTDENDEIFSGIRI